MYQRILAQNLFKGERFKHPEIPGRWYVCTSEPYIYESTVHVPCKYNAGRNGFKSASLRFTLDGQVEVWNG